MLARRGDIFYAGLDFLDGVNSEGISPILILDNQMGSRYKPTVICAVIAQMKEPLPRLPVHIKITDEKCPLAEAAVISIDVIHTIDKKRIREKICRLDNETMAKVEDALKIMLCLNDTTVGV